MTNEMRSEFRNFRNYVLTKFKEEYEPNSYEDFALELCFRDIWSSETIYTEDAESLIKTFPLSIIHMFLESKSEVKHPDSSEDIVYKALMYFCDEYMYPVLLKAKQNIDGGK